MDKQYEKRNKHIYFTIDNILEKKQAKKFPLFRKKNHKSISVSTANNMTINEKKLKQYSFVNPGQFITEREEDNGSSYLMYKNNQKRKYKKFTSHYELPQTLRPKTMREKDRKRMTISYEKPTFNNLRIPGKSIYSESNEKKKDKQGCNEIKEMVLSKIRLKKRLNLHQMKGDRNLSVFRNREKMTFSNKKIEQYWSPWVEEDFKQHQEIQTQFI